MIEKKKRFGVAAQPEVITRVKTPYGKEMFGIVESTLGNNTLQVRCQDNKMRICRIPGRMRKRIWMNIGDVVIMEPAAIQGDKRGEIVFKYRNSEVEWLRRRNLLTM